MPTNPKHFKSRRNSDEEKKASYAVAEARIKEARGSQKTELDLHGLNLTELPDSIGELKQLRSLRVDSNRLEKLPQAFWQLTNLQTLDLSHNRLRTLPQALTILSQLRSLLLAANQFATLPDVFDELSFLEELSISDNELTALPASIFRNDALRSLCASINQLETLPELLGNLTALEFLALDGNPLFELPASIGRLTKLKGLALMAEGQLLRWRASSVSYYTSRSRMVYDTLKTIPETALQLISLKELFLHGHSALGLPPEILGPSWLETRRGSDPQPPKTTIPPASILDYYFKSRDGRRPLNEAKMILVGRGGVGKTCLVNRLVHGTYNSEEKKTNGISITSWPLQVGNDYVRLNIWDFGGQEIMHATHQFFLTKRSLYLLVLNAREGEQDANVEYWLQLVESFGSDSPVLVVINKVADHPYDLNRRGLQTKFPAIRGFVQTDCETKLGIEDLRNAILRETDKLEHLRDPFPVSWFTVKDTLANLPKNEGTNFIPFARYQELCSDNGVTETTSQETLVGFLHDLGIVVNFRDNPRLSETQVLDPEWVTNGIYKILNADWLAKKEGELRLEHLSGMLDQQEYPKEMHLYLLDLMRKFELCYEFYDGDGHYLVPELLGKEEPDLMEFASGDALRFEYCYNILPEGLLPRFIVRSRALNKNLPRWRTGVVLTWDGNRAVVKADVQDRRVKIIITGPLAGRRRLLAVIRADLEHIHRSITKLQSTEQVPVPGQAGLVIEYTTLCVLEAEGESEAKLVHNGKMVKVKIADLLGGVEEPSTEPREQIREAKGQEAIRLAFSYSHKDEELRDQLETHLKLLQRHGVISTWHDRKILGGENWAGIIDDNFKRADLILLLVSADFLASDYCYEIEMKTSLEREEKGKVHVMPVILRACDWKAALFGKLQGFPKDMKPVTSWLNRDEAWTDVAAGIKKVAEAILEARA